MNFYNLKTRSHVDIADADIKKKRMIRKTKSGEQVRYALVAEYEGTPLYKFVSEKDFLTALVRSVEGSTRGFVATMRQAEILGLRGEIVAEVKENLDVTLEGRRVQGVFLTHHHPDHIGDAARLALKHGVPIFCHRETAARIDVAQSYPPRTALR
jgi:glyoxylase-like metal-dependent hydrolase (beta-lactamase superfamily II)